MTGTEYTIGIGRIKKKKKTPSGEFAANGQFYETVGVHVWRWIRVVPTTWSEILKRLNLIKIWISFEYNTRTHARVFLEMQRNQCLFLCLVREKLIFLRRNGFWSYNTNCRIKQFRGTTTDPSYVNYYSAFFFFCLEFFFKSTSKLSRRTLRDVQDSQVNTRQWIFF